MFPAILHRAPPDLKSNIEGNQKSLCNTGIQRSTNAAFPPKKHPDKILDIPGIFSGGQFCSILFEPNRRY